MPRNRDVRLCNFYPLVHSLTFRAECKGESTLRMSPAEDSWFPLRLLNRGIGVVISRLLAIGYVIHVRVETVGERYV